VRTIVLATAVATALSLAGQEASAQSRAAATKADVQAMQTQLQALTERLNRLEAANTQLQTENTELKAVVERRDAETDYLKSQTKELREEAAVASNEIAKVKGADWATKIKARGDLRYRHEEIHRERTATSDDGITTVEDAEDRYRHRIRARFGIDAQGSAGSSASPFWSSSIEMLSGVRTKAMRPSRGGRLIVTPPSISRLHVS